MPPYQHREDLRTGLRASQAVEVPPRHLHSLADGVWDMKAICTPLEEQLEAGQKTLGHVKDRRLLHLGTGIAFRGSVSRRKDHPSHLFRAQCQDTLMALCERREYGGGMTSDSLHAGQSQAFTPDLGATRSPSRTNLFQVWRTQLIAFLFSYPEHRIWSLCCLSGFVPAWYGRPGDSRCAIKLPGTKLFFLSRCKLPR